MCPPVASAEGRHLRLEWPLGLVPETDAPLLDASRNLPGLNAEALANGWCELLIPFDALPDIQDAVLALWDDARRRPGARLMIAGTSAGRDELVCLLRVLECALAYDIEQRGSIHCTPTKDGWDWGCLFLAHISPPAGTGKTRQSQLREILAREAAMHWLHQCPHFDQSRVEARIMALPDSTQPAPRDSGPHAHAMTNGRQGGGSGTDTIKKAGYADIGGLDDVVNTLRESVELPLRHPEVLQHLGITPRRGVLLHGPPGCGKTLLARAVACESGALFLSVSGPELITKWHGESEERLRELFRQAREGQPAVIFFDELDAVAQARSADESLRLDSRFTAQLLTLMDGVHDLGQVFILGATNRIDLLDSALLRPGRFDIIVEVPSPDRDGRLKILEIHTQALPLDESVSLPRIADLATGMTGADIALLTREAAYVALRRKLPLQALLERVTSVPGHELRTVLVTMHDMMDALAALRNRAQAFHTDTGHNARMHHDIESGNNGP